MQRLSRMRAVDVWEEAPPVARRLRATYAELAEAARAYWSSSRSAMVGRAALAYAQLHICGNRVAASATQLAIGQELLEHERDPDRASALVTLQEVRAAALGTLIDEWLEHCNHAGMRELARMREIRDAREPDAVARAASLVLARVTELLG
jgi:hypothetical protein